MEAAYCEGKKRNGTQQADNGIEEWEDAGQHSGDANNDGSIDQFEWADRELKASDVEDALVVEDSNIGEGFLNVLLKSVHDRLPADKHEGKLYQSCRKLSNRNWALIALSLLHANIEMWLGYL